MLFIETPSNPLSAEADSAALAQIGRDISAIQAVDNYFRSPSQQTLLLLGADIVTHSAAKYLDRQGSVLGGALKSSEEFIAPVVVFNRSFGPAMHVQCLSKA